jgi:hypothetical protein
MAGHSRDNALDHVVVFENRSLDNVPGRLYGPDDGKLFGAVTGKDLTNPIHEWPGTAPAARRCPTWWPSTWTAPIPTPARSTRTPTPSYSASSARQTGSSLALGSPTMDGVVTDYISTLTVELGRQPTYMHDALAPGQALSILGKAVFNGVRAYAEQNNIQIEGLPADPRLRSSPRACAAHHPQLPRAPVPAAAPSHPGAAA